MMGQSVNKALGLPRDTILATRKGDEAHKSADEEASDWLALLRVGHDPDGLFPLNSMVPVLSKSRNS
jgi:hypothetical protein